MNRERGPQLRQNGTADGAAPAPPAVLPELRTTGGEEPEGGASGAEPEGGASGAEPEGGERGWLVVVPVKPATAGKSRLDVPGVDRVALARAIALDTVAAAAACDQVAQVVVVTDDALLPLLAADIPGLRFLPETGRRADAAPLPSASPLDAAVAVGAAIAPERPRAALLGDLPALRPEHLAAALRAAASVDRGVAADTEGTGSTLVTAAAGLEWRSAFGEGSFARHEALGCVPLDVPADSSVRRDVDTAAQLAAAVALGVGPRTAALLP